MGTELILILVLAVHLLAVNIAAAGPLVCVWFEWREGKGEALAGRVGRSLAGWSIVTLLIGTALGVAQIVLVYDPLYKQILTERLGSKVTYAGIELVFSLVLMLAQWLWWRAATSAGTGVRVVRIILLVLASTNLLYHFPFLFGIIAEAAASGQVAAGEMTSAEFREAIVQSDVLSRTVHYVLASFAVCGGLLVCLSTGPGYSREEAQTIAKWGGKLGLTPTLAQIPVGLWVLISTDQPEKLRMMGGDLAATVMFGISFVLALLLMHHFAKLAIRESNHALRWRTVVVLTLTVVLMTGTLRRSREYPGPSAAPAAEGAATGGNAESGGAAESSGTDEPAPPTEGGDR